MTPVHRAPYDIIGVILIKQMVDPFIINQAIGIIHPLLRRRIVILRSEWFSVKGSFRFTLFLNIS
jgi:hypothetical protein